MKDLRGIAPPPRTSGTTKIAGFIVILFALGAVGTYAYVSSRPTPRPPPVVRNADLPSPSPPLVAPAH